MTNDALSGELFEFGNPKKVRNSSSFRHFIPFWRGKHDELTKHTPFTKLFINVRVRGFCQKWLRQSFRHGVSR